MRPTDVVERDDRQQQIRQLPLALYWRTTISVVAGAVAVAIAPSVMAAGTDSTSGAQEVEDHERNVDKGQRSQRLQDDR